MMEASSMGSLRGGCFLMSIANPMYKGNNMLVYLSIESRRLDEINMINKRIQYVT